MLGKLVNKFKNQSLQDPITLQKVNPDDDNFENVIGSPKKSPKLENSRNAGSNFVEEAQPARPVLRKSARLNPGITTRSREESSVTVICLFSNSRKKPFVQNQVTDFKHEDARVAIDGAKNIFDSGTESDDDELERLDSSRFHFNFFSNQKSS